MRPLILLFILVLATLPWRNYTHAADVDVEVLQSLKTQANYDQNRRKQFNSDRAAKKIFSSEREKGLGSFLEEQEKWDLQREKGLREQRKLKRTKNLDEDSPEYRADLKQKENEKNKMETARRLMVRTRDQVIVAKPSTLDAEEMEELGLLQNRPRFDLRKRGKNKWVKGQSASGAGKPSSGGSTAPPQAFDDFPVQPDYMPAPAPIDGFEEIPPPPPPVNYDGVPNGVNGYPYNIDSGFGDAPPPPSPQLFDDFNQ